MRIGGNIAGGKTNGETWAIRNGFVEFGGACLSNPKNAKARSYPDDKACGSMFTSFSATMSKKIFNKAP